MRIVEVVGRDPRIMSGALCFRGTRVLVSTLFDYLAEGHPIDRFLVGFPGVSRDQVEAVLAEARTEMDSLDLALAAR